MIKAFALAAMLALAFPAYAAEPSPDDRAALLALAHRMDRAWTMADADSNAELFAPDATARFGEDPLGSGRVAIRDQFRSFFKDRPPSLRHVTTIERIEQLTPDLTLWDAEVRVERRGAAGDWETLTRIRNVTVAERRSDGWRVRAVRAFPIR